MQLAVRALLSKMLLFFVSVWLPESSARQDGPALQRNHLGMEDLIVGLTDGSITLRRLRRRGLEVFTTPFNTFDGFGDGPFDHELPQTLPGNRPTLQGNGLLLLVNGLDAQSCNECHSIVRQSARPPILGIGGVGGAIQNALVSPSLIDVADSSDDRVGYTSGHDPELAMSFDGKADFNGRVSNPPFLFGGGGVELLAKEMTADLQEALATARVSAKGTITELNTHGVNFGHIETLGHGRVELRVEGIGFKDNSTRSPEEILVVRPFGRKGENFSMRNFDRGAMQFHFGIQPVEVVGQHTDPDGDGVLNEMSVFDMSALHVFDVTNPAPFIERLDPSAIQGFQVFDHIGCSACHIPIMKTRTRHLQLSFPEIPHAPRENVYMEIDLADFGFEPVPGENGVFVPLFADLKRHDMGDGLKEDFELAEISNREFTTARLWGVADTAPYLHDGRATTLTQAIVAHGGEAQPSRIAFEGLSTNEREQLIHFLGKLRTPIRPNEELLVSENRPRPRLAELRKLDACFAPELQTRHPRIELLNGDLGPIKVIGVDAILK